MCTCIVTSSGNLADMLTDYMTVYDLTGRVPDVNWTSLVKPKGIDKLFNIITSTLKNTITLEIPTDINLPTGWTLNYQFKKRHMVTNKVCLQNILHKVCGGEDSISRNMSNVNTHTAVVLSVDSQLPRLSCLSPDTKYTLYCSAWTPELLERLETLKKQDYDFELALISDELEIIRVASLHTKQLFQENLMSWWACGLGSLLKQEIQAHETIGWVMPCSCKKISSKVASTPWFDHIYYINLSRRPDRLAEIEVELSRFNLGGTRISAVDGQTLGAWNDANGIQGKYWNKGALACAMSHRNVLLDAKKHGYEKILVLEDDAVLTDNFLQVLQNGSKDLPDDWHLLYLSANHGHPVPMAMPTRQDRIGENLYKLKGSLTTHGIIYHKRSYGIILGFLSQPYAPLDMFYATYQKVFPCYILTPGVASQRASYSDVQDAPMDYMNEWKIDFVNHLKPVRLAEVDDKGNIIRTIDLIP